MKKPEITEKPKPKSAFKKANSHKRPAVCQVFASCRCTICGAFIEESDDTCANGHTIGQTYYL